jgi:dihydrofolate reductase
MIETSIIVAIHRENGAIGNNGHLLFRLKEDMRYFKELTLSTSNRNLYNVVIMGYHTWKSIPVKFKPLSGRINIILSKNHYDNVLSEIDGLDQVFVVSNYEEIDNILHKYVDMIEKVFYIGGALIYKHALLEKKVDKLYITEITTPHILDYNCDTVLDPDLFLDYQLEHESDLIIEENVLDCTLDKRVDKVEYRYMVYKK